MNSKNYSYHILLLLSLVVVIQSCTSSFKSVYIETARPSESMLPNDIVSLTLMNRSITNEFENYPKDSIQKFFYKQKFQLSSILLDSMAADTTLKVLGELLFESGRYDVVIPEERNIYRGLRFYKIGQDLNWDYVENICELYNTDALLVMERYYNKISTEFGISGFSYNGDEVLEASIDSKYDAVFKIYDPRKKEIVKKMVISDTIYWYNDGTTQAEVFGNLPPIKEVLLNTGIQVALDMDDRLSPSWRSEHRGYFSINNESSEIINYINEGDWENAYNYWLNFTDDDNKGIRSKAEFNMALSSEMLGDIDEAIEWAKKSYFTQYRKQTEDYLSKLSKRKEYLQKFEELEN
ncbi:DUF6340 family protein [Sunxiuqinia sp. A32]|uniref:DUF6340 family protein n=1 Tax=Sunxiuqinia sp. A32 TaxID=3461496 RepID=UPI004045E617